MSHSQLQGQPACHAKRSCRLPCRAADCPRCQDMGSSSAATPCLSGTSNCVWCCSSGGLAPHVLENKALFDRFGVPSDLLLQDLTFEDEQAKKVSPTNKKCPYMAHQHSLVPGGSPAHFQSVYLPVCCTCFFAEAHHMTVCPSCKCPAVCRNCMLLGSTSPCAAMVCPMLLLLGLSMPIASHTTHSQPQCFSMDTATSASAVLDLSPTSFPQVSSEADRGNDMLKLSDIGASFDAEGGPDYLKEEGDEDEEQEMDEAGEVLCYLAVT